MRRLRLIPMPVYRWIVWHLPRRMIFGCAMRMFGETTTGQYSDTEVPALTVMEMFARWGYS